MLPQMDIQPKPNRTNLWYTLLLLFLGVLLLKGAFFVAQRALSIVVLSAGVILIGAALVIFWKNFRE